jgi:hypothetical protein
MKFSRFIAVLSMGVLGPALAPLLPARALADECNGHINIEYPELNLLPPPGTLSIGDTTLMRVRFGTGTITGGPANTLTINTFRIDLACRADPPFVVAENCEPDVMGGLFAATFADSLTDDCPGTAVTSLDADQDTTKPNVRFFKFDPPLVIPKEQPVLPGFCHVDLRVQANSLSNDLVTTPTEIEEVVGYDIAMCDNGVLLSGGFQTSSLPVTVSTGAFSCYQVTKGRIVPNEVVKLEDIFGTFPTATLTEVHGLCVPANKNDEDPNAVDSPAHLAGYEIAEGFPGILAQNVAVSTQFGNLTVDVKGPERLLVPSSKTLVAPPAAPLPPGTLRHFLCHDLTNIQGDNTATDTTVEDQFSDDVGFVTVIPNFTKKNKWRLCVPVSKNDEEPDAVTDPAALFCFWAAKTQKFPTFDLFLNNQFGPDQFATQPRATQLDELCVAATYQIP